MSATQGALSVVYVLAQPAHLSHELIDNVTCLLKKKRINRPAP
jgi:hypothetical protein